MNQGTEDARARAIGSSAWETEELETLETPVFLLDLAELERCAACFQAAFPDARVYYALKANSEPAVLETMASAGVGFEAASWYEIELLLRLGVAAKRIIYGTAVKPEVQLRRAVEAGVSCFAVDSAEEVALLARVAPASRVLVRAKVNDRHAVFRLNEKFGAPPEAVAELLRQAADCGLIPWGLSFHVGSQAGHAGAWAEAITMLVPAYEALVAAGLRPAMLNLGGGFPAAYDGQPELDLGEVAAQVAVALERLPYKPQLMLEPGRALVATSTQLLTSVVARIERPGGTWLYLDGGSYNALFEALSFQGRTRYPVRRLSVPGSASDDGALQQFTLAGPTGDSLDVIARDVSLPAATGVGDLLVFAHTGAYTRTMACKFNGFPIAGLRVGVSDSDGRRTTGSRGLDTVASRLALGFPKTEADWARAPARFSDGELRILGHPVMQGWERSYMRALAAVAGSAGGCVLELGYGLGISAAAIQANPEIERHIVIEFHPQVAARCLADWSEAVAAQRLQLAVGTWQQLTPRFASGCFDGILFDTYPLSVDEVHCNHLAFFAEAFRLLRPGGVLTYYSDEADSLSAEHLAALGEAGFLVERISSQRYPVTPPAGCEYWQKDSLVVPCVRK